MAITSLSVFSGSVGIGTIGGNAGTFNAWTINAINALQINGNNISNIYVSSNGISNYLSPYDLIPDRQTATTTVNNNMTRTLFSINFVSSTFLIINWICIK